MGWCVLFSDDVVTWVAPQLVRTMEGHSGFVAALAVSPDSRFVYSGSFSPDKTVKQWDASCGAVRSVALSCCGVL